MYSSAERAPRTVLRQIPSEARKPRASIGLYRFIVLHFRPMKKCSSLLTPAASAP